MPAGPDTETKAVDQDAQLLAAAELEIEPVRIAFTYQVGLVIVATGMLLLPILYVVLIVALGYGVWYHAAHSPGTLFGNGISFWRLVFYVAPIFAGATGILFMIKPIFARQPKPPPPLTLSSAEQPLLHDFVRLLCRSLGTPAPREIRVDMQVNASASFRRGVRSMLGRDLVLTLGLPFVAGLNVAQLSGVLAHEFGHFSQAIAMRFSYLIGSVNHWFVRVVYERDAWDEKLEKASREAPSGYAQVMLLLGIFLVWLSRRVLWVLMYVGHVLSAYMSRQMEYNADKYQVQVVGSSGFRPTYLRMGVLDLAGQAASGQVNDLISEGRLATDFPALTQVHALRIERFEAVRSQITQEMLEGHTGLFDTHPSGGDRVHHAEHMRIEPRMKCSWPGRSLFRDFDALSERTTSGFYEAQLGDRVATFAMVSTEDAAAGLIAAEQSARAAARVLFGGTAIVFGIAPTTLVPVAAESVETGITALKRAREKSKSLKESVGSLANHYGQVYAKERKIATALLFSTAGMKFSPDKFGVSTRDTGELVHLKQSTGVERKRARESMKPVFAAIQERVDAAVALASNSEISDRLTDEETTLSNYQAIGETLRALAGTWPYLADLDTNVEHLTILAAGADQYAEKEEFNKEAERMVNETHDILRRVCVRLSENPYPFEHARGPVSIANYAVPTKPRANIQIIGDANAALERIKLLYGRCWGELARLVERVEGVVGLPEMDLEVREEE
jgi:Zn-dependent protease with chaperone function